MKLKFDIRKIYHQKNANCLRMRVWEGIIDLRRGVGIGRFQLLVSYGKRPYKFDSIPF